jgi:hypothetical protein
MGYNSARYIHTLYQVMNLAFADRDFYYGDPYFPPPEPIRGLLSKDYARDRLKLIDWRKIDIDEDGTVYIATNDGDSARQAREKIEGLTESAVIGRIYTGKVVRVTDFGAFVEILPNIDGMVHISQLANRRITKVSDVVKDGDMLKVKVLEISRDGKIRLSHKAVLEEEHGSSS